MKKKVLVLGAMLVGMLMLTSLAVIRPTTSGASAQLDGDSYSDVAGIYLKIDALAGEARERLHQDWIEILSYDWNESALGLSRATGGVAATRVVLGNFHFVKEYDKSSPSLFLYCAQGKDNLHAQLDVTKRVSEAEVVFIRYDFDHVNIASYSTSGAISRSPGVLDEFSLSFTTLTVRYTQYGPDGAIVGVSTATYDFSRLR